ncbi:MAG: anti-sigma factor family protein, partial [Actinopolymorphaceae bacterium]
MTVDPHLGNDLLADFLEGLLADHEAAGVHAHLRACGSCHAVADSLSEVRLLLRDAGTRPAPMPVVVSDRLEAMIGAESAARGAKASGAYEPGAEPEAGRGRRVKSMAAPGARKAQRKRLRWVPALAAAASVA